MVTFTEEENTILEKLMANYPGRKSASLYLAHLLHEEDKRQEAAGKKSPGRPKKDGSQDPEDEPRDIPHPDQMMNPGVMMTQSEFDTYQEVRGEPKQ